MRKKIIKSLCNLGKERTTINKELISCGFIPMKTQEHLYFARDALTEHRIKTYCLQKLAYPH